MEISFSEKLRLEGIRFDRTGIRKTGKLYEPAVAHVEGLRQKFLGELRWFTDMIDTLRVEDTLYKKETNV